MIDIGIIIGNKNIKHTNLRVDKIHKMASSVGMFINFNACKHVDYIKYTQVLMKNWSLNYLSLFFLKNECLMVG